MYLTDAQGLLPGEIVVKPETPKSADRKQSKNIAKGRQRMSTVQPPEILLQQDGGNMGQLGPHSATPDFVHIGVILFICFTMFLLAWNSLANFTVNRFFLT